jgi:DNA-binding NtrC family response regulator
LDVRVMAATQCDLRKAIDAGRFRADLYYRLNVINIRVPALRVRKADIPAAAEFFLRKHRTEGPSDSLLSPALRQAMLEYEWPGNLRELENMMCRLLVLQNPDEIVRQLSASAHGSLPDGVIRFQPAGAASSIGSSLGFPSLEKVNEAKRKAETEAILRALDASRWNRKQAAKILRIDYKALLYKMHKLEIDQSAGDLRTAAGGA